MMLARILACLIFLSLTACTFNPFTTDNQITGNPGALAVGGAVGAGTVALLGADKTFIALAGIGGASLGYYLSTLGYAAGGVTRAGGEVYTVGQFVAIVIPSDEIFDSNTAEFLPVANNVLQSAVAVLNRFPDHNVIVSDSTSGFGTRKFELALSERRARAVASYLWASGVNNFQGQSIEMRKLIYVGYGNYFPIANDIRAFSIRQNSRIQITAYPTRIQLHLDPRHRVFSNMGESNDIPLEQSDPNAIYQFDRADKLPENNDEVKNSLSESTPYQAPPTPVRATGYYPEAPSYKGESVGSKSNGRIVCQTRSAGRVVKHGGYKGE